ncbi:MAG TPA: PrsW family glutamic-type intramembrane protease [Actinoplanes sp.]|nr:PrsW family glutamic-type intramembrane protease [Actinoplanes sp.]
MADVTPGSPPDRPETPSSASPAPASPVIERKTGWRRWLPLALVIGFIAACAIVMLLILGFSNGVAGLFVGLVAAFLPVPVLVSAFLWLDRYEPEPTRYLVFCFAWGSSVATLIALGVNTGGAWLFDRWGLPEALVAVLVAPFIEELMKALGPILLLWKRQREWSGITDGIVYCGLSALGFAMVENVLYLGGHGYAAGADQYGPATGIRNVFLIFIVRILFTGFAHPLFTSMTGVGLGLASRSGDRRVKWLAPIAGLLLAMILHGAFNLLPTLSVATGEPLIMLYGYLGFMVPFFFLTLGFAIALRGWEGRLSERILPNYVRAGWFAPPEVAALSSLGRRHSARRWARRVGGDAGLKAMRSFQSAATRLAVLRDGMQRGLDRNAEDRRRSAEEEYRLLNSIARYRSVFAGRDPQMPPAFWDGSNYRIAFPDGVTRTVPAPAEPVVPLPVRMVPQPALAGYGAALPYGIPPSSGPSAGPSSGPSSGGWPGAGSGYGAAPSAVPPSGPSSGGWPGGDSGYGVPPSAAPHYGGPPSAPPSSGWPGPGDAPAYGSGPGVYGTPRPPGYGHPELPGHRDPDHRHRSDDPYPGSGADGTGPPRD